MIGGSVGLPVLLAVDMAALLLYNFSGMCVTGAPSNCPIPANLRRSHPGESPPRAMSAPSAAAARVISAGRPSRCCGGLLDAGEWPSEGASGGP